MLYFNHCFITLTQTASWLAFADWISPGFYVSHFREGNLLGLLVVWHLLCHQCAGYYYLVNDWPHKVIWKASKLLLLSWYSNNWLAPKWKNTGINALMSPKVVKNKELESNSRLNLQYTCMAKSIPLEFSLLGHPLYESTGNNNGFMKETQLSLSLISTIF